MHLAELNVGRLLASIDDPKIADFKNALDAVNALAERSPGFVWRMTGEGNDATDIHLSDDGLMISNLSVWESVEALKHFVRNTVHNKFVARRAEWFEAPVKQHFVMWRVEVGHIPTLNEALDRLAHLEAYGDSDHAFGWAYARAMTPFASES